MRANYYLSAFMLCGIYAYAQPTERPDTEQPAITVADVEQDAKEASDQRKTYEADKLAEKDKIVADNTKEPKKETTSSKSLYTSTRKSSKKPGKQ